MSYTLKDAVQDAALETMENVAIKLKKSLLPVVNRAAMLTRHWVDPKTNERTRGSVATQVWERAVRDLSADDIKSLGLIPGRDVDIRKVATSKVNEMMKMKDIDSECDPAHRFLYCVLYCAYSAAVDKDKIPKTVREILRVVSRSSLDIVDLQLETNDCVTAAMLHSMDFCAYVLIMFIRRSEYISNLPIKVTAMKALVGHALSFRAEGREGRFDEAMSIAMSPWSGENKVATAGTQLAKALHMSGTIREGADPARIIARIKLEVKALADLSSPLKEDIYKFVDLVMASDPSVFSAGIVDIYRVATELDARAMARGSMVKAAVQLVKSIRNPPKPKPRGASLMEGF